MSYTLEQKREAFERGELWWRFPSFGDYFHRQWTLMSNDLGDCLVRGKDFDMPGAEYLIGTTPPRVISELEGELLEACKRLMGSLGVMIGDPESDDDIIFARAAIKKAEATP